MTFDEVTLFNKSQNLASKKQLPRTMDMLKSEKNELRIQKQAIMYHFQQKDTKIKKIAVLKHLQKSWYLISFGMFASFIIAQPFFASVAKPNFMS